MAVESDIAVIETADTDRGSYVDWPAIIAGIVLASAISILFLTFGSAVGLSFADFDARPDVSPIWVAVAAAAWLLWVQISSFMAGGYLTGRLRKRHADATEDEVDIRDGSHGLLVWAGALVIGALLAVSGIGAAATAVGSAAATITTAAAEGADGAAEALDPNAYFIDMLFRAPATEPAAEAAAPAPAAEAPAATTETPAATTEAPATGTEAPAATTTTDAPAGTTTTEAPAGTTTTTTTTTAPAPAAATTPTAVEPARGPAAAETEVVRDEVGRIFARGAMTDGVSADDRVYLAQLVAENTALSDEEATARVDQVMSAMDAAAEEAAEAAETARKTAVIAAFLTAASFLVSAVGAWWAAQMGGNHRDNNVVFPGAFRRL
jgi:hypothetical protein